MVARRHKVGDEWLTAGEIAERSGHCPNTIQWRIAHKWPIDLVMSRPLRCGWVTRTGSGLTYKGQPVSQKQLAEMAGVSQAMMSKRLTKKGMTPEEAVAAGNYRVSKP